MEFLIISQNIEIERALVEKYVEVLYDLLLIRNIIAHGYMYEGEIFFDDDWSINSMKGETVTGRDRSQLDKNGKTRNLGLETSPYKIGVLDALLSYQAMRVIREATGLIKNTDNIKVDKEYERTSDWLESVLDEFDEEKRAVMNNLKNDYYKIIASMNNWGDVE